MTSTMTQASDAAAKEATESRRFALAIMAKAPAEGMAKTRLVPPLSPAEAAGLSRCFIADTADNVAGLASDHAVDGVVAYTPVGQEAAFDGLVPPWFRLLPQRGGDLGERLCNVVEDLLATGYDGVFLINSDSPDLPPAVLRQAVAALGRGGDGVVLGPAVDGGYYLIGLRRCHRHLFAGIDWSTERVLAQTMARAAEAALAVDLLPAWYDIDDAAALSAFRQGAVPASDGLARYPAPRTRLYLDRLGKPDGGG
jgi:rSAM/selenodomain-associated transferase 1